MENEDLFKKVLAFAESGKGRRLLNALISKNSVFTSSQMDELLKVYCKIGLPKEVESLKKRRGILGDDQYNALAEEVRSNCCSARYDDFVVSLRILLTCGMKMNPTKMDIDGPV